MKKRKGYKIKPQKQHHDKKINANLFYRRTIPENTGICKKTWNVKCKSSNWENSQRWIIPLKFTFFTYFLNLGLIFLVGYLRWNNNLRKMVIEFFEIVW